jgi:hypothetical protein
MQVNNSSKRPADWIISATTADKGWRICKVNEETEWWYWYTYKVNEEAIYWHEEWLCRAAWLDWEGFFEREIWYFVKKWGGNQNAFQQT